MGMQQIMKRNEHVYEHQQTTLVWETLLQF